MRHIWGAVDQRARVGPPPKPAHPPVQPGRSLQPEAGRTCAGKGLPPRWAPSPCSVPPPPPWAPGAHICARMLAARTRTWCAAPATNKQGGPQRLPGHPGPPQPDPASHSRRGLAAQARGAGAERKQGPGGLGKSSFSRVSFRKAKPVQRLKGKQSVTLGVTSFSCGGTKPGRPRSDPDHPQGQGVHCEIQFFPPVKWG